MLYEDREVLAVDKPPGWMLAPPDWRATRRNLWAALEDGVAAGAWWAKSRGLRLLRPVHRLDTDTSGVLLLGKSLPAIQYFSRLFATGAIRKTYLTVTAARPIQESWTCRVPLADRLDRDGRIRPDPRHGKPSETAFTLLHRQHGRSLIEARPLTGRTHQIRVHLSQEDCPIIGDTLYGGERSPAPAWPLALRAVELQWDRATVSAPRDHFLHAFGLDG